MVYQFNAADIQVESADDAFSKDIQVQLDVINHLNNYIYVVNPETFQVLFMNNQTRKRINYLENAGACYELFRGNKKQCEDCPIKELAGGEVQRVTREIYNAKLDIWLETSVSTFQWTEGFPAYLIECADISRQKQEHLFHIHQLEQLAFVDELTGSRTFCKFKEDAPQILKRQMRNAHFLVKLDIENFKLINQIYGYEKGDEILRWVARAIEKTTRNADEIFARVFNDEFVALFALQAGMTIAIFCDAFTKNFDALLDKNLAFKFTFAYGIYVIKTEDVQNLNIKDLFEKVNVAHKAAKVDKTNRIVIYDETMINKALHSKEIENKMAKAMYHDEFVVYLQPKYDLDTEMIGGAEALTRWQNVNTDLFSPDAFIPVFEKNGFITRLDFHMLHKVCHIIKNWLAENIEPVVVSVNFSRLHLNNLNFVKELCEVVDHVGIDRKFIEIEITETAVYDNIETFGVLLTDLHACGFTMSMDDFGSGYSSLGMLKDLPVDVIKMDRSFFANQKDAQRSKIVVGSIIKMAEALDIRIVAEGVEDQAHIDLLRELDCDMVQGYYYAKPMKVKKFTELIKESMLLKGQSAPC